MLCAGKMKPTHEPSTSARTACKTLVIYVYTRIKIFFPYTLTVCFHACDSSTGPRSNKIALPIFGFIIFLSLLCEFLDYCNATFDSLECWPPTPANQTVLQQCPPVKGVDPNSKSNHDHDVDKTKNNNNK